MDTIVSQPIDSPEPVAVAEASQQLIALAARVAAMQTMLTQGSARPYLPLAAAACKMPPVRTRTSSGRRE